MATMRTRLGTRLKQLRTAKGLSQAAVATRAKISREYVNKLEAGQYDPTLGVVRRLAQALGVTLAELVE